MPGYTRTSLVCFGARVRIQKAARIMKQYRPGAVKMDGGERRGERMENKRLLSIETVIDYVEQHLDGKVDLEKTAEAVHYSKYHLHRMFTETVGMTLHDYVQRRQLTEAAKLLAFSRKPISEVAFICGYESQQAFSTEFK